MKKHAMTILLVLAALALGLWLWLDRDRVTEGERKKRENSVFTAWRRDELARLVIAQEGETITLVRDPKKDTAWRMTSPREERADVAAVERLMTTLEFAVTARKVADGTTGLGLETPRAHGEVHMGGIVTRFALGGPSPRPEGSSYFRIDDHPPIVVSKELTAALLQPADTYRDRTVVPYLSLDLAKLEVKTAAGGFTLERVDDRAFRVAEAGVLAGRETLDKTIWSALAEMRAEVFPKDADADRLTAAPKVTLIMTPKEAGKPVAELVVGDACPGHPSDVVVLRKSPSRVAACAPKAIVDALSKTPGDLVARRAFSVKYDEIEELRLERVGDQAGDASAEGAEGGARAPRAVELARKGTGYHLRAPEDRDLDAGEAEAATELLGRIADVEGESVTKGGGAPFAAVARARVRFGDREETVEVSAPDGEGRVVIRRASDDARLLVSRAIARRLMPRETTLRRRHILEQSDRAISRIVLRCGAPQELVDDGSGFRLVDPKGFESSGTVRPLAELLTKGRIDLWVADEDDGTFGFSPDGCRAVLGFADGKEPATLHLGKEGEGGVYGRLDTRSGVFVAPVALRKYLSDVYVSGASLRSDFEHTERVRVTVSGKPVTQEQPLLREAMGRFYAKAVGLGRSEVAKLPPPEVVIEVVMGDGGGTKRISCGPRRAGPPAHRLCTKDGVDAVFEVEDGSFVNLLPAPPAPPAPPASGADARPPR